MHATSMTRCGDAALGRSDSDPDRTGSAANRPSTSIEPTPDQLGRYHVLAASGRGGMGVVYRAWDPRLRRQVAIKVIRSDRRKRAKAQNLTARLLREARTLAQLCHPNVVPVYDVGLHAGAVFVAMEYVEGMTLRQWLTVRPRSPEAIAEIFARVADGLAAAHAAGVIHRDVKPGNIMVTANGRVYVADFGLACVERGEPSTVPDFEEAAASDSARACVESLTDDHAAIGTLPYMSPEQHTGQPLDARADQYGLCIALFEALYGRRPFAGRSAHRLLARKIRDAVPPDPLRAEVPAWLHRVTVRGLSPKRADRFVDMATLAATLRAGLRSSSESRRVPLWAAGPAAAGLVLSAATMVTLPKPAAGGVAHGINLAWSEQDRVAIASALRQTGAPFAEDIAARVTVRLDAWAARWQRVADARGGDATARPQAVACIRNAAQAFDGIVDALHAGQGQVVHDALTAVAQLPEPSACPIRPQPTGAMTLSVASLRAALGYVQARGAAGDHDFARARLVELRARAEALGYAPLTAETLVVIGNLERAQGWDATAERTLTTAFGIAVAAGDDALAQATATTLTDVVANARGRVAEGLAWGRRAATHAANRTANDPAAPDGPGARWALYTGRALLRAGRLQEAHARLLDAAAPCTARPESADALCGALFEALAQTRAAQGDHAAARTLLDRALHHDQRWLGPGHPRVADLLVARARLDRAEGRFDDALAMLQRARTTLEAVVPSVPGVRAQLGRAQHELARTLVRLQRQRPARRLLADAAANLRRAGEPTTDITEALLRLDPAAQPRRGR